MTSNFKINTTSSLFSGNPTFAGTILINNTTAAVKGSTTGGLVVNGGLGIESGNVVVNGDFFKDQQRRVLTISVNYSGWVTTNDSISPGITTEQVVRKASIKLHPRANRIIARFEGDYTVDGYYDDEWLSRLYINNTLVKKGGQFWDDIRGGDSRSRTLLPLTGLGDVTGGSTVTIEYRLLRSSVGVTSDDYVRFNDMKLTVYQMSAL